MITTFTKRSTIRQITLTIFLPVLAICALALVPSQLPAQAVSMTHRPVNPVRTSKGSPLRNLRNQMYSTNWSGYAVTKYATGTTYTSASANWSVPSVASSTTYTNGYSSSWVGIGGFCLNSSCTNVDNSLIQLGTEQDYTTAGSRYYAWYETLPQSERVITNFTVKAGDKITASLANISANYGFIHQGSNRSQLWQLTLRDTTRNESWVTDVNYNSSLTSAEWVQEAPYSGGVLPLANFGTATFDSGTVNGNNNPELNSIDAIVMENAKGQTSNPSNPDSDTDGFNACWGALTTLTTCVPPAS